MKASTYRRVSIEYHRNDQTACRCFHTVSVSLLEYSRKNELDKVNFQATFPSSRTKRLYSMQKSGHHTSVWDGPENPIWIWNDDEIPYSNNARLSTFRAGPQTPDLSAHTVHYANSIRIILAAHHSVATLLMGTPALVQKWFKRTEPNNAHPYWHFNRHVGIIHSEYDILPCGENGRRESSYSSSGCVAGWMRCCVRTLARSRGIWTRRDDNNLIYLLATTTGVVSARVCRSEPSPNRRMCGSN